MLTVRPMTAVLFHFDLSGKYQARILSESLLSPAEYQREVHYELVTGKVDSLGAFFSSLCPGKHRQVRVHTQKGSKCGGEVAGLPHPWDLLQLSC